MGLHFGAPAHHAAKCGTATNENEQTPARDFTVLAVLVWIQFHVCGAVQRQSDSTPHQARPSFPFCPEKVEREDYDDGDHRA